MLKSIVLILLILVIGRGAAKPNPPNSSSNETSVQGTDATHSHPSDHESLPAGDHQSTHQQHDHHSTEPQHGHHHHDHNGHTNVPAEASTVHHTIKPESPNDEQKSRDDAESAKEEDRVVYYY